MSTPADNGSGAGREGPPLARERRVNAVDRRALTWRTLLTSGLSPRRRGGRRAEEQDQPVDFHEPRLLLVAVFMLLLSVADALLTVTLMTDGAEETNPLLAFVLTDHPRLFAVVKMALTGFGVVLLVAVARARLFKLVRASVFLMWLAAAYCGLVAYEAWLVRYLLY
jgi:hypothetical protein